MNRLFFKVGSMALLVTGLTALPQTTQGQETSVPVPARANENDPNSEIYRASDIMGLPIKNDQDQEIGKIKDLVINGSTREVLYAVVGMNDAKEKDAVYVMPWTAFQPSFGQGNAIQYTVLTIPQTVWIQAPFWTSSQWRQMPYAQWSPRVNQYYESHIHTNTASNSKSTTVRTNKPVLKHDDEDKAHSSPAKDKPSVQPSKKDNPQPKNESNNKPIDPPKTNVKPNPKQPVDPKASAKPGVKEAEVPAAKNPKLPAPKNPDPAGPETVKPAVPREPKIPAPTPKS
ncbi:PRC-barrel domain-containing protein [Schlesneria paludicola]|uniref:PRC-barrel domain-containing protein n=1 Tax=Schlesneria paludicola TaxID=360056 RepID=UPI00029B04BF|nr:PRC-barrel domain-containing protein [Schlesneria paludicola]